MNSRKLINKLTQKNKKESYLIDYSSNEEQSGILFFKERHENS